MLDFRIETFLTVCKYMNFTRAAEELNITQPAVSHHIHFLENYYEVPLFLYEGKKLQLTAAGSLLRDAAVTMKHDEVHMKRKMQQVSGEIVSYSFGATLSVAEFILVENLNRFIGEHKDSRITMQVADTKELLKKLNSGELDFAIVEGDFPKTEYEYFICSNEEYVAAADGKLADKYRGKTLRDLFRETLLLREEGSGTREILDQYLMNHGYTLSHFAHMVEIGNIGAIKALMKEGRGISFLYRAAIRKEELSGELKVIPLADFRVTHEIAFIFRKGSIFYDEYKKIFEELRN